MAKEDAINTQSMCRNRDECTRGKEDPQFSASALERSMGMQWTSVENREILPRCCKQLNEESKGKKSQTWGVVD